MFSRKTREAVPFRRSQRVEHNRGEKEQHAGWGHGAAPLSRCGELWCKPGREKKGGQQIPRCQILKENVCHSREVEFHLKKTENHLGKAA